MDHLSKNARAALSLSNDERKRFVKAYKWIGYSMAIETMHVLEELVDTPRTTRMPDVLVYGPSNNGKTVIIEKFAENHKMFFSEELEMVQQRVLMVETPPQPDEKRFYQQILRKLVVPFRINHRAEILFDQVVNTINLLGIKVLVIDEIHHLLSGTKDKKQVFLNALKSLSNQLKICIVAVGTKDAFHVFQSDPQMRSRFEPHALTRWKLDKDYIRFLNSYEKTLPLPERSNLFEKDLAIKILSLSDHTIGGICGVLKKAAIGAIEKGEDRITLDLINRLKLIHPDVSRKMPLV